MEVIHAVIHTKFKTALENRMQKGSAKFNSNVFIINPFKYSKIISGFKNFGLKSISFSFKQSSIYI